MNDQISRQRQDVRATALSKRTQKALVELLESTPGTVLKRSDLATRVKGAVAQKRLPQAITLTETIAFLETRGLARVVLRLPGGIGDPITRFTWGPPSMYALGVSLRPGAYLSHASAVFLHGLTEQIPKTIYVNKEQSPKPPPQGQLTQEAIDRAFSNSQRSSTYVFEYQGFRFVLLNGKNTNRLEVSQVHDPQGESVDATKLERTLIDIAVRPAYAGGVFEVLKAFRAARDRISVNTLVATLKALGYVYPYHQAVGFYLERAGMEPDKLARLKQLGLNFDFYLAHKMGPTSYSPEWRIHFPEGL
jgi:hypothetical protein